MTVSLLLPAGSIFIRSHLNPHRYMGEPQEPTWSHPNVPVEAPWRVLGH